MKKTAKLIMATSYAGLLAHWHDALGKVATNSFPKDKEAVQALDDVCVRYCHAFSDANTLHQTSQVVGVGQVWIGKTLMQRLT